MKFNEKLQKLRKEHHITQEGLADRLGVSRQAVSKWESGSAYPDMDKLISISKMFNISLDELVNDKEIKNAEERIKKIDFREMFNVVLDFISRSINMFWAMKFSEKIKFLFEMALIVLITVLIAFAAMEIVSSVFRNILIFLPSDIYNFIMNVSYSLLYVICLIFGVMIVIKVFKNRYLDYYIVIDNKNDRIDDMNSNISDNNDNGIINKREYKVIIRDPDDSRANIFDKLLKICINLFKCFCFFIAIPLIFISIFLVGCMIIDLFYLKYGLLFIGIDILILGALILVYLFIEFIYNVIFNRKHAYSRIFIMFIISIFLMGMGIGLSAYSFSTFEYIDSASLNGVTDRRIIEMNDDLVFVNMDDYNDKFVIDNSINDIKMDIKFNEYSNVVIYSSWYEDMNGRGYKLIHIHDNRDEYSYFKMIVQYLTDKKIIRNDDMIYDIDKIYISEDNLTKIKNNYKEYTNDYE